MAKSYDPSVNLSQEWAKPALSKKNLEVAAYYNWLNRGCPTGDDQKDWFEARNALENLASGKRKY